MTYRRAREAGSPSALRALKRKERMIVDVLATAEFLEREGRTVAAGAVRGLVRRLRKAERELRTLQKETPELPGQLSLLEERQ
jgi:hypothetical protein